MIDQHFKTHLQRLLRLHQATPAPVVFLLAGCLPMKAQLHLRMFSLFGQLCRLRGGDNILARHASNILSSANPSSKSWFWRIRELALQYGLPHPSAWISLKPSKFQVKSRVKAAVLQYWLENMRAKAHILPSLKYLKTEFLGLTRCHPIFRSCGSSPWEVEKATTQARLLSGRYRLESLSGHWTPWNKDGLCTLPGCWGTNLSHKGTVESFLLSCPSLATSRQALYDHTRSHLKIHPELVPLVSECLKLDEAQFWLDCSTMSPAITAVQVFGESILFLIMRITRNYCHGLHKARTALLDCGCG